MAPVLVAPPVRAFASPAFLTVLLLAGCGGGETASPAERTPAAAFAYGEVVVQPEGELQENVDEVVSSFPGGDQLGEQIIQGLEEEEDVAYAEDVEPWLGARAGAFALPGEGDEMPGAALVETTDEDAARDFLEQSAEGEDVETSEYQDVEVLTNEEGTGAVFDGLLVVGDEEAVLAAIDTREEAALADDDRYTEAVEQSEEETRLAIAVIDIEALAEVLPEEETGIAPDELIGLIQGSGGDPSIPVVLSVSVDESVVRFEQSAGGTATGAGGEALASLPGDSSVAFALSELPPAFTEAFELGFVQGLEQSGVSAEEGAQVLQRELGFDPVEVLDSLESLGIFVRGAGTDLGGAFFADLASEADVTSVVDGVRRLLVSSGVRVAPLSGAGDRGGDAGAASADGGFTIPPSGEFPFPLVVTAEGARLLVATSPAQAAAARGEGVESLEDSGALEESSELLGEGFEPTLIADGNAIAGLVALAGAADPEAQEVVPYLEPIGRIASGSTTDGDLVVSRTAIEIK